MGYAPDRVARWREVSLKARNQFSCYLRKPSPASDTDEILQRIDEPFRAPLLSMYRGEKQVGADGQMHAIDTITKISALQGIWMWDVRCSVKPNRTREIGMGYGFSTLFFLAAIAQLKVGHHTAVDPFQRSDWHRIGIAKVRAVGMESKFSFLEDYSSNAATDLARANRTFDLIFIDGNHRFDDVLADFYLYAPLRKIGVRSFSTTCG
jgi:hypothetical protein